MNPVEPSLSALATRFALVLFILGQRVRPDLFAIPMIDPPPWLVALSALVLRYWRPLTALLVALSAYSIGYALVTYERTPATLVGIVLDAVYLTLVARDFVVGPPDPFGARR